MGSQHVVLPLTSAGGDIQSDIFYLGTGDTKKYPPGAVSWCRTMDWLLNMDIISKYQYNCIFFIVIVDD